MKCEKAKKEIKEVLNGGEIKNPAFFKHIEKCKKCSKEYRAAMIMKKGFSSEDNVRVPLNFNSKVWEKIGKPSPRFLDNIIFAPSPFIKAAGITAAVILLLIFTKVTFYDKEPVMTQDNKAPEKAVAKKDAPAIKEKKQTGPVKMEVIKTDTKHASILPLLRKDAKNTRREPYKITPQENATRVAASKMPIGSMEEDMVIMNNVIKPLQNSPIIIKYKVEETSEALIVVYSRIGEPVKTVYKGTLGRGVYEAKWYGEDKNNTIVDDGIYIIYVKTGLVEKKIKAIVVK